MLDFHSSLLNGAVLALAAGQPIALRYSEAGQSLSQSVHYVETTSFVESLWRICLARGLVANVYMLDAVAPPHADRRVLATELRRGIGAALDDGPHREG